MKITLLKDRKQRGVTLLEGLLVLAIAAGLAIAAYAVFRNAKSDTTTTSQARGTIALASQIVRLYAQDTAQYTNLTTANIISAGIVPADFVIAGGVINNKWGGTLTPSVGNQAGTTPVNNFKFTVTGIPADSCVRYVTAIASSAGVSLWVNGTTAGTNDVVPAGGTFNASRASTACAIASPATVTLVAL